MARVEAACGRRERLMAKPRRSARFGSARLFLLEERKMSRSSLAGDLGTTRTYVSGLTTGRTPVSPGRADEIAESLNLMERDRIRLHRAVATDHGFSLDLPDGF